MLKRLVFISSIFFTLLFSCREYETITLLSDNIDALTLAEVFNQEHDHIKISVDYRKNLLRQLEDGVPFDIIIGNEINSRRAARFFSPIEQEFFLDTLYPELLAELGDHSFVPVSFNLETVVFKEELSSEMESPLVLSSEKLRNLGEKYNKLESRSLVREGFSPLWNDNYLYLETLAKRVEWNIGTSIEYSSSSLESCLEEWNSWITQSNNGLEDEFHFINKYRYIPRNKLLLGGFSRFEIFSLKEYMEIVQKEKESLDFRYLSFSDDLFVTDRTFAAISEESRKKNNSYILEWILDEKNQKKILLYKQEKRMDQFGFFGGLSSVEKVSHEFIPELYPELNGKIPHNRILKTEDFYQPYGWQRIKKQVIIPWIKQKVETGFSTNLEEYYEEWLFHTISE